MNTTLLIVFLFVAIILICLIMSQEGTDNYIRFGAVANMSKSILFLSNSNNLIIKLTSVFAGLFFIFSLVLGNISNKFINFDLNKSNSNNIEVALEN